ncbi:hypothetical protein [Plantactinospora soyae]|uniref:Uncharacterized protein n=1 Tax=Plantactinospora soyae TaxID=1544732 RepID=A0A927MA58_9ACTN|nr:hypothetical protein [Plantactinospora soyae]MBE1490764.1 hypothetical protein [Plantactinospora soyae]
MPPRAARPRLRIEDDESRAGAAQVVARRQASLPNPDDHQPGHTGTALDPQLIMPAQPERMQRLPTELTVI